MTNTQEKEWLKKHKCKDCGYLVPTSSHPIVDYKPLSNRTGFACIMLWATDGEGSAIIPNWNPESCECEMFYKKKEGVAHRTTNKVRNAG